MQVRNDKARKYLTDMRRKKPVTFSEKFLEVDPLALRLLQRLLSFDPKDRPTAEQVYCVLELKYSINILKDKFNIIFSSGAS